MASTPTYVQIIIAATGGLPDVWLVEREKISDEVWDALCEQEGGYPEWYSGDKPLFDVQTEGILAETTTLIDASGDMVMYPIMRIFRYQLFMQLKW